MLQRMHTTFQTAVYHLTQVGHIICAKAPPVASIIDLYGRFAAEKLTRRIIPHARVLKTGVHSATPYLFSGADVALIPSRDEPFGFVVVGFGRKGALGVGGLGLMLGWVGVISSLITRDSWRVGITAISPFGRRSWRSSWLLRELCT
ncbi:glycosyltransferase family 5 protein [Laccaria bicolor S238N-H82]|uniref:Glycosyltransferase family 5 protein n=1 Tax=Laccaria bicolor (strain S238N-H82 / ATCC MYA-4686) TaxID=486041 RepID=B0DZ85_LACBS|nr:glycosyltransferase family 5 protein [Laccaria bicolor S238N-H82]EDR00045.1 glycosyltransferase family 5 protein [Laccaria bicolor S238N-H82]|eukprot:XP_001889251.1 glycosyltransferase family 5 protein [Laccaria bicolor S238N-H82]